MSWLIYAGIALIAYKMLIGDTGNTLNAKKKPTGSPKKGENPATRPKDSISPQKARNLLGIEPDANADAVRRAYQNTVRQYHPDVVANAAPEIQALAEKRTKEINAAYEYLKKLHN